MAKLDVEDVLTQLSLEEKISLLAGTDFWHTKAIPRLGVPALRTSDGPNGVRGTRFFNGVPAACFPCGTGLGSTWDQDLLVEAGQLMGREAIAKGAHVILGPCINMQRSPLGGRGFESISEDPVLAGLGAAALIKGIQSTGVVATIKHFVTNDQEHERNAVDSIVTERALREIYLMPFQLAVRDARPGAFMTAYNKLNGTHLSENHRLLTDIVRREWGWNGVIMSDWFGTYSADLAVNAGLDLEMPGPTRWRGGLLGHMVNSRKVAHHTIDERVRNMLNLVNDCERSGVPENAPEGKLDNAEASDFLRKVAADSIVLVKNENQVLPLPKDKDVLLIGPGARWAVICGGGSSSMAPYYAVSPFDGVKAKLASNAKLEHKIGCYNHKELPLVSSQPEFKTTSDASSEHGLLFRAYNDPPSAGSREAVDEIHLKSSTAMLMDYYNTKIKSELWYADIETYFTADRTGSFEFGLCVYGTGKLYVDGKEVVDNATKQTQGSVFFGCGTVEEKGAITLQQGKTYHVKLQFASAPTSKLAGDGTVRFPGGGFRIGGAWVLDPKESIADAAKAAKRFHSVVILSGLNGDWEGEGADRVDMKLPSPMDEMIAAVAEANPRTVVVNQSGTPVEMPWFSKVAGLLQAWYGGNETGNAIADVLFGDVNPSGRSSLSWPKRVEDNPAFYNYRSEGGRVLYGEDVYMGYRHYEMVGRDVLFPFGWGLSYSSFRLGNLKAILCDDQDLDAALKVTVDVENTSQIDGKDVVQVFIRPGQASVRRPPRELKGFKKVFVGAGSKQTVELNIDLKYATSYWDEIRDAWISEKGTYEVEIQDGIGAEDSLRGKFEVGTTKWWNGI